MKLASILAPCLAALLVGCGGPDQENIADRAMAEAAPSAEAAGVAATPRPAAAPAEFQQRIEAVARPFQGDVGIAVKDLKDGWAATWQGDKLFPQQSTMKIWMSVALLDAVDRGDIRLDEVVRITPPDLSVFNQPMVRPLVMKTGGLEASIERLLDWSISKSDNAATDILMRRLGGGPAVQAVLERKGVRGVQVGTEERVLQPRISGLEWRPEFIDNDLFEKARDRTPDAVRDAALEQYLRSPPDGATPVGTVNALEALAAGKLLSPQSTELLLRVMSEGRAGAARLRAGLPEGWALSHKTGTGPDWRKTVAGYNDVGVLTAPDGHAYAVAVYIGRTDRPVRERQIMIADVARAVVEHWRAGQPPETAPPPPTPPVGAPPLPPLAPLADKPVMAQAGGAGAAKAP
jgi:beta-lactamase class A